MDSCRICEIGWDGGSGNIDDVFKFCDVYVEIITLIINVTIKIRISPFPRSFNSVYLRTLMQYMSLSDVRQVVILSTYPVNLVEAEDVYIDGAVGGVDEDDGIVSWL